MSLTAVLSQNYSILFENQPKVEAIDGTLLRVLTGLANLLNIGDLLLVNPGILMNNQQSVRLHQSLDLKSSSGKDSKVVNMIGRKERSERLRV